MNLKKLLAENLIRYGVKNIDIEQFSEKFLTEQTAAQVIAALKNDADVYKQFKDWESKNAGRVKLTKTFGLRTLTEQGKVSVPFFNNFVTIDQGSPDPAGMKKQIDAVLDSLAKQGANLNDPKIIIEIVSTATSPKAGKNIDEAAAAAGRKTIDHNYGGKASELDTIQKKDEQWGNRFLAQQRGESAKSYIESKGIQAKIIVVPQINAEKREFIISAKVQGTEKYVNPVNVPPLEITLDLRIQKSYASQARLGQYGDPMNQYYSFEPILKIYVSISTNFGVFGTNFSFPGSNSATTKAGMLQLRKQDPTYTGTAWSARIHPMSNEAAFNPFAIHSQMGGSRTAEEFSGKEPKIILGGIGHFTQQAASTIPVQLRVPTSPLWEALHGLGLESKILAFKQQASSIRSFKSGDENAKKYDSIAFPDINITKTFNASELAKAATSIGLGASEQLAKDIKYWMEAVYFDATTNPPSYGSMSKNPSFFDDVASIIEQ